MYEVELKFAVTDVAAIEARFVQLGARPLDVVHQSDLYFAHPVRCFAESNEALRLRSTGTSHCVTYKGPVIDKQTKMRREIEIGLQGADRSAAEFQEMLGLLGFEPVREVQKRRQRLELDWSGRAFELAIDSVTDLGTFVELETLADEASRDQARAAVLELAAACDLHACEPRSYLRMLIERDTPSSDVP